VNPCTLLFVYGTLKRGCSNHGLLAGQRFIGVARTAPGYRLYDLGSYPGLVADAADARGVIGEVWSVDPPALLRLDELEGVDEGLYRREPIALAGSFAGEQVAAYFYARPLGSHRAIGPEWRE
jgi:gamma-glutamylaminecyclotransferase